MAGRTIPATWSPGHKCFDTASRSRQRDSHDDQRGVDADTAETYDAGLRRQVRSRGARSPPSTSWRASPGTVPPSSSPSEPAASGCPWLLVASRSPASSCRCRWWRSCVARSTRQRSRWWSATWRPRGSPASSRWCTSSGTPSPTCAPRPSRSSASATRLAICVPVADSSSSSGCLRYVDCRPVSQQCRCRSTTITWSSTPTTWSPSGAPRTTTGGWLTAPADTPRARSATCGPPSAT